MMILNLNSIKTKAKLDKFFSLGTAKPQLVLGNCWSPRDCDFIADGEKYPGRDRYCKISIC